MNRELDDSLACANPMVDEDPMRKSGRRLGGLMSLMRMFARSLDDETMVGVLLKELPLLIEVDLIGIAAYGSKVWTWSKDEDYWRAHVLRSRLSDRVRQEDGGSRLSGSGSRMIGRCGLSLVPPLADLKKGEETFVSAYEAGLTVGEEKIGLLYVERSADRPFAEQELEFVRTVTDALALAFVKKGAIRQIEEIETKDPLTGLLDRRALETVLHRQLKAGLRYGIPTCLLVLDLDYFKVVNERLGHAGGDGLLKEVASLVEETVRKVDRVARYGGEAFAVVSPHTDLQRARTLAERIRDKIERRAFIMKEGHVRITASVGVASMGSPAMESVGRWIAAADSALDQAKSRGRNRVVVYEPSPFVPAQAALCLAA
ncbi:MAG: GGDEF domain-containing protein [Nitrospira sp.]|nr:GGDEF domain-containing protein [Nitrospira sp.]